MADLRRDNAAVTPVIGTVFILGITVAGMAVVLLLGTPVIDRLQDEAALATMAGQFEGVRYAVSTLSIPQASKAAGLSLPGGEVRLATGDRIMVTYTSSAAPAGCDFHVTQWATADNAIFVRGGGGCGTPIRVPALPFGVCTICIQAFDLTAAPASDQVALAAGGLVTLAVPIELDHDWLFRLTNGAGTTIAEAFLFSGDRLDWERPSSVGGAQASFEAGAIFLGRGGQTFQQASPFISEKPLGTGTGIATPYLVRIPMLDATGLTGISGSGDHSLLLQLASSTLRAQVDAAVLIRFDIHGTLAQEWCSGLVLRNAFEQPPGRYDEDLLYNCATGNLVEQGVRSVTYTPPTPPLPALPPGTVPFQLVHARLAATIQL
ncbi:MAG: hypothetical protein AABX89_06835 [Candidatus Thermoplasmatota archaeon]